MTDIDFSSINTKKIGEGVVLTGRATAPEIYVEGVTQMLMGAPVSRLIFHTTMDSATDGDVEVRKAAVVLSLPTGALVDIALKILEAVKSNQDRYIGTNQAVVDKWAEQVRTLSVAVEQNNSGS